MNYVLDTKFAMMPQEYELQDASATAPSTSTTKAVVVPSSQTSISYFPQEILIDRYGKYVKKVFLHMGTVVKVSEVSGPFLIPPVTPLPNTTNRYPTLAAEGFLKSMENLGLRDIDRTANE